MGPLISAEHFEKVSKAVEACAKKEKGKILAGGEKADLPSPLSKGYFYKPTVFADLTNC